MRLVINAVLFQVAWWSAALLQDRGLVLLSLLFVLLIATNSNKKQLFSDLCIVLPVMIAVEQLLMGFNMFKYTSGSLPLYILLLWLCLVSTLRESLAFLFAIKKPIGFTITVVFSALSYYAAAKFGVVTIDSPLILFFPIFGFVWASSLFLSAYISTFVTKKYFSTSQ